jgi:hypothetical protein
VTAVTAALLLTSGASGHHLFNWAPPTHIPLGAQASGVVTGDFNGDGHTDIVAIAKAGGPGGAGNAAISFGNGSGAFGSFTNVHTGGSPVAIEAGHLDADGRLDLAVANAGGQSTALVPASADFARRVLADGPSAGAVFTLRNGPSAVTVNGAAITGTNASEFALTGNTCTGPLAPFASCNLVVTFDPSTVGTSKSAALGVSTSSGSLTATLAGRSGSPSAPLTPAATDFGGRVVGSGASASTPLTFRNRAAPRTVTGVAITGPGASQFEITDDDCTGQQLTATGTCEVDVNFEPTSNGVKTATVSLTTNPSLAGVTATLTGAGSAGEIAVLMNDGTGDFELSASLPMDTPTDVKLDKLDRDDVIDVIASSESGDALIVWPGQNDGGFKAPLVTSVSNPVSISLGNVNFGASRDVAVASAADDLVRILLGDRTGRFSAGATYAADDPRSVFIASKLNKDNYRDLVYTEYGSNRVTYRYGAGDGTFGAGAFFTISTPTRVVVADVSNQGDDLIVTDESGDRVSIMLSCGGSIVPGVCVTPGAAFDPPTHWPVGDAPGDIAVGNFDNQFSLDMVISNAGSGNVSVMINQTPCPGSGGCD